MNELTLWTWSVGILIGLGLFVWRLVVASNNVFEGYWGIVLGLPFLFLGLSFLRSGTVLPLEGLLVGTLILATPGLLAELVLTHFKRRRIRLDAAKAKSEREKAEEQRLREEAAIAKQRDEIQAEKARLREERERSAAVQSLHAHLGVITGAVRAIRAGADNTVLITTIDEELKAIGRNPKITQEMLMAADVREEVELIVRALAQRGVDDQILLNRLHKLFRMGAPAGDPAATGPLSA